LPCKEATNHIINPEKQALMMMMMMMTTKGDEMD
jgi:hypothetical protein